MSECWKAAGGFTGQRQAEATWDGGLGLCFLRESGEALKDRSGDQNRHGQSLQMVGGKVPRVFTLLYFPASPDFLTISFSSFVSFLLI